MFKSNNIDSVLTVNFEHISHLFVVFLMLTLKIYMFAAGGTATTVNNFSGVKKCF